MASHTNTQPTGARRGTAARTPSDPAALEAALTGRHTSFTDVRDHWPDANTSTDWLHTAPAEAIVNSLHDRIDRYHAVIQQERAGRLRAEQAVAALTGAAAAVLAASGGSS